MIHRRALLAGLFAAPAIIAIDRLMPVKALIRPSLIVVNDPRWLETATDLSDAIWRTREIWVANTLNMRLGLSGSVLQ